MFKARVIIFFIAYILSTSVLGQSFFSIIDDDAQNLYDISKLKKLADEKGIKITFAVIPSRLTKNQQIIDSLLSYQNQGFQICNHSYNHNKVFWNTAKEEDILSDINLSESILDSLGFINHNYLVYPYGKFSPSRRDCLREVVSTKMNLAFNSRGFYANLSGFDKYYLPRFPIRKHDNMSMVKAQIDKAIKDQGWIVFMTHSSMNRDFSLERLEKIIDYCQSKGLQCLTLDQAYNEKIKDVPQINDDKSYNTADDIFVALYMHLYYLITFVIIISVVIIYVLKIHRKK